VQGVRFWPKADIPKNAIDVAFGGKADMPFCIAYVCLRPKADICGNIPDLSLTRVRNWTSVQLDFSAHNQDNQNEKVFAQAVRCDPSSAVATKDIMNGEPRLRDV